MGREAKSLLLAKASLKVHWVEISITWVLPKKNEAGCKRKTHP